MPTITTMPDLYNVTSSAGPFLGSSVLINDENSVMLPLTASLQSAASFGSVVVYSDGAFSYTPNAGYSGPDSFHYTATDGSASAVGEVSLNVSNAGGMPGGGTGISAPSLQLSGNSVAENSATGTLVATLSMSDPNPSNSYTFTLLDDADGRFKIVGNQLQVDDGTQLDYETTNVHSIVIRVTSSGGMPFDNPVTITVTDVNETPEMREDWAMLEENAGINVPVGVMTATDPDFGQTLTYTITAGNTSGAFAIDPTTGALRVANAAALDFETNPLFSLTIQATDNGAPALSKTATFTVALKDQPETELTDTQRLALLNQRSTTMTDAINAIRLDQGTNGNQGPFKRVSDLISAMAAQVVTMRARVATGTAAAAADYRGLQTAYQTNETNLANLFSEQAAGLFPPVTQLLQAADAAIRLTEGDTFRIKGIRANLNNVLDLLNDVRGQLNQQISAIADLRTALVNAPHAFQRYVRPTEAFTANLEWCRQQLDRRISALTTIANQNTPPVPQGNEELDWFNDASDEIDLVYAFENPDNPFSNSATVLYDLHTSMVALMAQMTEAVGNNNYDAFNAALGHYLDDVGEVTERIQPMLYNIDYALHVAETALSENRNAQGQYIDSLRFQGVKSDLDKFNKNLLAPTVFFADEQVASLESLYTQLNQRGGNFAARMLQVWSARNQLQESVVEEVVLRQDYIYNYLLG